MAKLSPITQDLILRSKAYQQGMADATAKLQKFQKRNTSAMASVKKLTASMKSMVGAAAALAGVAGLSGLVRGAVSFGKEMKVLAGVANAGFEEFQRLAYGAKQYNIEQEKLADIYKDTNDKIGDFLQTGGGAMADFFQNIAPRVGITAKMFKGLSGPQALQLYYNGLEKANLSQQEMTFYMEAISSDATALIPLLRNGGKEFQKYGEEVNIMTKEAAASLAYFQKVIDRFNQNAKVEIGNILGGGDRGIEDVGRRILVAILGALAEATTYIPEMLAKVFVRSTVALGAAIVAHFQNVGQILEAAVIKVKGMLIDAVNAYREALNEASRKMGGPTLFELIPNRTAKELRLLKESMETGPQNFSDWLDKGLKNVQPKLDAIDTWAKSWRKDIGLGVSALNEAYGDYQNPMATPPDKPGGDSGGGSGGTGVVTEFMKATTEAMNSIEERRNELDKMESDLRGKRNLSSADRSKLRDIDRERDKLTNQERITKQNAQGDIDVRNQVQRKEGESRADFIRRREQYRVEQIKASEANRRAMLSNTLTPEVKDKAMQDDKQGEILEENRKQTASLDRIGKILATGAA